MKTIRIYNSYRRFFYGLIVLFGTWYGMLLLSEVPIHNPLYYVLAFCLLVSFMGSLIRTPLLTITPHSIILKREEFFWEDIAELRVGNKRRNLSFIEKLPNPFARYGAFNNYNLILEPIDQPSNTNVLLVKRINLNSSEIHPDIIDELLWNATRATKVMMYREEEVE